jgi:uncharacterized protein (DUF433 family)
LDEDGAIRVGNSRVTLDILIEDFEAGATADEIASNYDTLMRAEVYSALAFYLNHTPEVKAYLQERELQAFEIERLLKERGMIWPEAGRFLKARAKGLEASSDASAPERRGFAKSATPMPERPKQTSPGQRPGDDRTPSNRPVRARQTPRPAFVVPLQGDCLFGPGFQGVALGWFVKALRAKSMMGACKHHAEDKRKSTKC